MAQTKNRAAQDFFSKWSLRPKGGSASERLTRRRPTRLRPRVRNPSPPLRNGRRAAPANHPGAYRELAIPKPPGARRGSIPCSISTEENDLDKKNTPSQD